jgi:septum formation protein
MRLVLASASPRRAELLRAAGFAFDIAPTVVDERVRDGETPRDYVRRLAAEKSAAAWAALGADRQPGNGASDTPVILGADTAVVIDNTILGKPKDDLEARAMLRRLSGKRHDVMTGVSLRGSSGERGLVEVSGVYMVDLRDDQIAWYVASGEGRDKAGAYGIQGLASRFVPRIEGSYTNVVGLPVAIVAQLLSELASAG